MAQTKLIFHRVPFLLAPFTRSPLATLASSARRLSSVVFTRLSERPLRSAVVVYYSGIFGNVMHWS